jgi:hypothetical protein
MFFSHVRRGECGNHFEIVMSSAMMYESGSDAVLLPDAFLIPPD